jgi:hypothetical protein
VDAGAEGDVAVGLTVEHDGIGVGNTAGSRLAAPKWSRTRSPAWTGHPPTVVSSTVMRAMVTGE